jgi:Tol biopolymer transport system component
MSADGSGEAESVFQSGLDAVMPAVRNKKVVWINQIDDYNIYSVPLTGGEPVKRIASPMFDSEPSLAPDGRIAYVSRRSGSPEIWIAASDTANSVRITNLKGDVGRPAWSPDGSRIAFSMQRFGVTTILSTHCTPGGLRCESPVAVIEGRDPAWSANGRFLYFTANLPDQIWRVPISGGPAMYVARGVEALASRDGRWLYVRRAPVPEFYRVGLDADGGVTGSEERVLVRKDNGADLEHWALAGDEIIFPENSINSSFSGLRAYNTVTKQLRTIVESATAKCPAVSPDGKTVWFAQSDATGATVMAAEFSQ